MLLISSESFPNYGLENFFLFAKKAGYDGVEIVVNENFDSQNPEYLKQLQQRVGLPILAFGITRKMEGKYTEAFQNVVRNFPGATLNLSPPATLSFQYKEWMTKIAPRLAKKYDLALCRKNMPAENLFGMLPSRTENSLYALRQAGDVCLDLSALWKNNEEIIRTIAFLGDSLQHIYLSNVHQNVPYCPPQNGILPVESFLTKLAQMHYRKNFTMKIAPGQLAPGKEDETIRILVESREFFQKYFVASGGL